MGFSALYWWIDRWRKSSAYMDMTLEEQGAYRNLLDEATLRGGPLPNDERILAKACGDAIRWKHVRATVMARFTLAADGWRNDTLDEVLHQTERRATKQQRYRNKAGNGDGNAAGNGPGHEQSNDAGNKPGSPDLDLDRECSTDQEHSRRTGARVFTGKRLKVSQAQHQVVLDELGEASAALDLPACYAAWDAALVASGEDFDALPYIKRQAQDRLKGLRRGGLLTREPDPEEIAARATRDADNERRAEEATALLGDVWRLMGEVAQRAVCDEARTRLKAQGFWGRMAPEARERASEAGALGVLRERFRDRDALIAERDRLVNAAALLDTEKARMAKADVGGAHAVAAVR